MNEPQSLDFLKTTLDFLHLAQKSRKSFFEDIEQAVYSLWSGDIRVVRFTGMMTETISAGYLEAFLKGARECGVVEDELTDDDRAALQAEIDADQGYILQFGEFITEHSRAKGGDIRSVMGRGEMWQNRYEAVKSLAKRITCGDQKLEWRVDPRKESCADCLNLNGRIYRASTWDKYDLQPRSRRLACGGFRCGCRLILTTEPATRGRPPELIGP